MLKNIFKKKKEEQKPKRFNMSLTGENIKMIFKDCDDFVSRTIDLGGDPNRRAFMCFIDGIVNSEAVSEDIIRPSVLNEKFLEAKSEKEMAEIMFHGNTYNNNAKKRQTTDDVVADLIEGFCAIIFEREKIAVTFEVRGGEARSVSEPESEKTIKGAKDGFVEIFRTNTGLIRKKLRNPDLKIKQKKVGRKSETTVAVVYMNGLTNNELVERVEKRLDSIDIDGLLAAANLEEYIIDNPKTPFPQVMYTERADKFCMNILEGRVGILIDGLPLGYLVPGTFSQFIKVPDDKAGHFMIASALTALRYVALVLTLFLPAFYVAVALYHQEMIPTKLMQFIIEAKADVPFSTVVEVLGMLIAFELIQEAGLRLPSSIGDTVSIIGALVVGQAAVEAKVISPVVVIVVAAAGIAGYTMPNQDMSSAIRICRFMLVLFAIFAGVFGISIGITVLIYHLCTLETFGVAYMTPFVENEGKGLGMAILRYPLKKQKNREKALQPADKKNQA